MEERRPRKDAKTELYHNKQDLITYLFFNSAGTYIDDHRTLF